MGWSIGTRERYDLSDCLKLAISYGWTKLYAFFYVCNPFGMRRKITKYL